MNPEQLTLVSVIYSSDATTPLGQDDLDQLLAQSRTNNADRGVTGVLLYRDERFLQVLEGSFVAVHALLKQLGKDERHSNVRVLLEEAISTRQFAEWSMGFEQADSSEVPEIPGYRRSYERLSLEVDAPDAATGSSRALHELMRWFNRPARTS